MSDNKEAAQFRRIAREQRLKALHKLIDEQIKLAARQGYEGDILFAVTVHCGGIRKAKSLRIVSQDLELGEAREKINLTSFSIGTIIKPEV